MKIAKWIIFIFGTIILGVIFKHPVLFDFVTQITHSELKSICLIIAIVIITVAILTFFLIGDLLEYLCGKNEGDDEWNE